MMCLVRSAVTTIQQLLYMFLLQDFSWVGQKNDAEKLLQFNISETDSAARV